MGFKRTGYDYIPSPGEDYHPGGKTPSGVAGDVVASGTDSNLVRTGSGDVVLTDKQGNRRK